MKNRAWGVTLFFIAVSIAVSALAAMPSDNGNGNAIVYVYRPHRFTAAAKNPSIYVDGREISRLHNGTYLKFAVAPGQHSLTSVSTVD